MTASTSDISAYICLGSNTGDTKAHMAAALAAVQNAVGITVAAQSPLYFTEPQDFKEQDWFCNQVLRLHCVPSWTVQKLLGFLLETETKLGRTRSTQEALRFGPRIIDMDLLLFGQEYCQDTSCTVPHPRMLQRAFVLVPLRHVLCADTTLSPQELEQALQSLPHKVVGNKIYQ